MGKKIVYKHTLFINVNNRVLNHIIEVATDNIKPDTDEGYRTMYNKTTEIFTVYYYTYENTRYYIERCVLATFRQHCDKVTNGIKTITIAE